MKSKKYLWMEYRCRHRWMQWGGKQCPKIICISKQVSVICIILLNFKNKLSFHLMNIMKKQGTLLGLSMHSILNYMGQVSKSLDRFSKWDLKQSGSLDIRVASTQELHKISELIDCIYWILGTGKIICMHLYE